MWGRGAFWYSTSKQSTNFSLQKSHLSPIHKCFLPQKFPTIQHLVPMSSTMILYIIIRWRDTADEWATYLTLPDLTLELDIPDIWSPIGNNIMWSYNVRPLSSTQTATVKRKRKWLIMNHRPNICAALKEKRVSLRLVLQFSKVHL